jgi:hypothetical protein
MIDCYRRGPPPPFTPASLFGGGDNGGFWDFTNLATLYQDAGFATPATTAADPVRGVRDLGPNGADMTGGSTANTLQFASTLPYIDFNLSSAIYTASNSFGSSSGFTVIAAWRADTNVGQFMDSDILGSPSTNSLGLFFLSPGGTPFCYYYDASGTSRNTATGAASATLGNDYITSLVVTTADAQFWLNAALSATLTASVTLAAKGTVIAVGGAFAGTSSPTHSLFDGRGYCAFFIGRALNSTERRAVEDYMAARIGITL